MPALEEWAIKSPTRPAILSAFGSRSFAELDANANRLARALRRRGLVAGDAVALLCGNRPEFVETLFACRRAGFRLTPINWHLNAPEAGYIIDDCEAKALVADSSVESIRGIREHARGCNVALSVGAELPDFSNYEAALQPEEAAAIDDATPGGTMLYTSGTTGRPKGVHRATETASLDAVNFGGYSEDGGDRHLCTGPLYHAAPLGFSLGLPLARGATVVLMPKWDAEDALRLIDVHRVTHTHMVPTMFHRLLALPESCRDQYETRSLRHVLHGAAPCPVAVKKRIIEWFGPIVWEYYAATEGLGTLVDSATWLEHPGTVGRPLIPGLVFVGDTDGQPLPSGEVGLVYLRSLGASRFSYFKDEEKTRSTFRGDYFTLGDVGYLNADGFLFLTDRSADLIISGGVNIYPAEVDAVLLEHPDVADAATIGVPDPDWGETVLSIVELRQGIARSKETAQSLISHCRSGLSHYKCPRAIDFVDALPRQDNGKIYKRVLREHYRDRQPAIEASRTADVTDPQRDK